MIFSGYVEEIVRNLQVNGESYIEKLRTDAAEENLQLEFKTKKEPNEIKLHKDDKQNLGKTLSGFSNAEGGIVIWGIATEKNENGTDKAVQLRPIADIENALEIFRNQCATSLQPENRNIKFISVKCRGDQNKGYIAIAIPKGTMRPYMSKAPDHSKYFRRTSVGFQPLEHYEIADMFLSNNNAVLELGWDVTYSGLFGTIANYNFELFVKNIGAVPATEPYFILDDAELKFGRSGLGIKIIKGSNNIICKTGSLEQVFPEETFVIQRVPFHREQSPLGHMFWGQFTYLNAVQRDIVQDLRLRGKVGCLNGITVDVESIVLASEIKRRCIGSTTIGSN